MPILETDHRIAWQQYMNRFGRVFTDQEFYTIFGTGNRELCSILFPDRDLTEREIQKIGDEKESLFRELSSGTLKHYPGFFEFLDSCDNKGIVMAVGSSACRENVDFILSELNIKHRFAVTVSSNDVADAKPAPDIFEKAAQSCGFTASQSLVLRRFPYGLEGCTRGRDAGGCAWPRHMIAQS